MNDIRIIQGRYVRPDTAMALRLAGYKPGPAWDKAMDMCQGRNPKDVFMEMCQQNGMNPNDIINKIK